MTLYEAVKADLLQYTASRASIDKALSDAGLDPDTQYVSADHKISVAGVVLSLLRRYLNLQAESEGGFSQTFNIDGLRSYLMDYASENELEDLVSDLTNDIINDQSDIW